MILSQCPWVFCTLKETPQQAESVSHQLLLRAGMIRFLSSGIYSFMPLGLKALRKVENIIRDEFNAYGVQEVLMPILQPSELWKKSGRWDIMGQEMLRVKNRQNHVFALAPTHEELVTQLIGQEIQSYKDLPAYVYQIQTKFRDEIRPRFGLVRCKEFLMKDAYSFHEDQSSLETTYQDTAKLYEKIFARCGLEVFSIKADSGMIGGKKSLEFVVLSESGEDSIADCSACSYKSAREYVDDSFLKSLPEISLNMDGLEDPQKKALIETKDCRTIEALSHFLKVSPSQFIKTLFYKADQDIVVILIKGDDQVNEFFLKKYLSVVEFRLAKDSEIESCYQTSVGFSGPCGLKNARIIADPNVLSIRNAVTGANQRDYHFINVNYDKKDYSVSEIIPLALVKDGYPCPSCHKNTLTLKQAMEVGHIFQLGQKYSQTLGAKYLDKQGKENYLTMGCYGIGIGRHLSAII